MLLRNRLRTVFTEALGLPPDVEVEGLRQWEYEGWDSLGHLALITMIEEVFDVEVDADQLIELDSFDRAEQILRGLGIDDGD